MWIFFPLEEFSSFPTLMTWGMGMGSVSTLSRGLVNS